jgi:hypothetical protein
MAVVSGKRRRKASVKSTRKAAKVKSRRKTVKSVARRRTRSVRSGRTSVVHRRSSVSRKMKQAKVGRVKARRTNW